MNGAGNRHPSRPGYAMTFRTAIARAFLLAATGLLASCLDVREEYWFQGDGGGRADITYSISAVAARMHGGEPAIRHMIDGFLADTPAITSSSYQIVTEGTCMRVRLQLGFASARDLDKVLSGPSLKHFPSAASCLLGTVRLDLRGTSLDFQREIFPAKALPEAAFLPDSRFAGHRLLYIMHLPGAATESNATILLDGGRTLVWEVPLERALKAPLVTRFKTRIPLPWAMVLTGCLALLPVGGLAFFVVRKARRRNSSTKS